MKRTKHGKRYMAALVLLALIFTALAGTTLAKYIGRRIYGPQIADPESFFFTTNFEQGGSYLYPAGKSFDFAVRNYDKLGNYNASEISYTVTVNGQALDIGARGRLTGGKKSAQTVTVPASMLEAGNAYVIAITASSPYEKTISFTVNAIAGTVENLYTVKDMGNWVQLDLYVGTAPAPLTIDYTGLQPDNLNELMADWTTAQNSATLTDLSPYTHYTLVFFGTAEVDEVLTQTVLGSSVTLPQ